MLTHLPIRRSVLALAAGVLAGCASAPTEPPGRVERLGAAELEARLPPPQAAVSIEEIVALSRRRLGAEEIIRRISESASRYRLAASQIIELAAQGVPPAVLDHILAAERTRVFDELAGEVAKRDKSCEERIAQERLQCRQQPFSYTPFGPWPGPFMNCIPFPPGSSIWRCY